MEKVKILIADDDNIARMLLTNNLKRYSSEILIATNGREAVELSHNTPDIDLIMMDIKMPHMDGYEATRKIREFNKEVIIIAETAYAIMGEEKRALASGCNDYITKPILEDKLFLTLGKYFPIFTKRRN